MNLKIYQVYYDQGHLPNLDSAFIPLDNTDNVFPELREFPVLVKMNQQAIVDNVDFFGLFSTRWKEKMPGLEGSDILHWINNNKGYDVYVFDPVPWYDAISYNVWEQGNFYHKHIIPIINSLGPNLGLTINQIKQPITKSTMFWCCYLVASKNFWRDWFNFILQYPQALENCDESIKDLHNLSANYSGQKISDGDLNYFPFVHERLLTTFVNLQQSKYKIISYRHNQDNLPDEFNDLSELKLQAVLNRDFTQLQKWNRLRQRHLYGQDLAQDWIKDLNCD